MSQVMDSKTTMVGDDGMADAIDGFVKLKGTVMVARYQKEPGGNRFWFTPETEILSVQCKKKLFLDTTDNQFSEAEKIWFLVHFRKVQYKGSTYCFIIKPIAGGDVFERVGWLTAMFDREPPDEVERQIIGVV
ncbi:hypothetical protein CDEST_00288 [Colletotrichum destructivum]|uniref:PH domain-containing protein n=1 Tax=Colletotrichum destructivum TaxID=34406 RepID=A0AAX4HW53_9PEZI|nr:hypothetical protein CDEST_00288 [Colletotrichum destructivum]